VRVKFYIFEFVWLCTRSSRFLVGFPGSLLHLAKIEQFAGHQEVVNPSQKEEWVPISQYFTKKIQMEFQTQKMNVGIQLGIMSTPCTSNTKKKPSNKNY